MVREAVTTAKAPAAVGPYSQGIKANGFLYVSGQLPIIMATGEQVADDIKRAVAACLANVVAIAEAGGSGRDGLVKVTMFLADMNDFALANEAYAAFFEGVVPPARSTFQVAKLPKNAIVEIEAIAAL
ncbi:MAG: Rid family detoxifying hydrolase [Defluviitaleaceae bacterium]|nr:Rid family detoxifying hydrolase [Defluviitaleaceae bacterium]MCL2837224.1 Rid family detoxifying hydrolase [Defluviitaleaceae bacterium]